MVSTRQMTGGSSDESSLHFSRATPTTSSSAQSCASATAASSTNTGTTVTTSSSKAVTMSGVCQQNNQSSAATPLGMLGFLSCPCASYNSGNSSLFTAAMPPQALLPYAPDTQLRPKQDINLMDLPAELLGHIFSFVGFKKIAQMRVVSHQMNKVCSSILNSTFQKLQNQMHSRFQTVKAKMPRRESARRNHPLACECDILETCYMRLSLLQMTLGKHIERKHCCFFPGAILDEVYSVLSYIRTSPSLDRPFKVTDELFDLSTMAMEYFKEHIEPNLPDIAYFTNSTKSFAVLETSSSILSRETSHSNSSSPPQSNMVLRKGIRKIKQGMKRYNNQLTVLRSELRTCKRKATEQTKTITEQQKLLAEQQKQTLEFANRLDETDKKNEELSRKFSTVLQELNKCKTELQYWRSNSPTNTISKPSEQVLGPEELNAFAKSKDSINEMQILSLSMEDDGSPAGANCNNIKDKEDHDQAKNHRLHPSASKSRAAVAVNHNSVAAFEMTTIPSTLLKPGQKRKLECVPIADATHYNFDAVSDNAIIQLDDSTCLNPPFSLASLGASFSSSATAATNNCKVMEIPSFSRGLQTTLCKNDVTQQHGKATEATAVRKVDANVVDETSGHVKKPTDECDTVLNLIYAESNADASIIGVPSTQHIVADILNDHLHTNTCANVSNCSYSRHSTISNDNTYHNKKLRRVQNKARSQSHKHINHSSVASTHTKATRSKQSDK